MKKCSSCNQLKEINSFNKDSASKDGRRSSCKLCGSSRRKEKINNPIFAEQERNRTRTWRKNNPEQWSLLLKRANLKRYKGLTQEGFNFLLQLQNNLCAICKLPETRIEKKTNKIYNLAIDHCHVTGEVRGLLCHNCNAGIGLLKDSTNLLQNAIKYLENTHN